MERLNVFSRALKGESGIFFTQRKPQNIEPQNVEPQNIFLCVILCATLRFHKREKNTWKRCKTKPEDTVSFLLAVGMTGRFLFYETGLCCRQFRQHNPVFFRLYILSFRRRRKLTRPSSSPEDFLHTQPLHRTGWRLPHPACQASCG